MHNSLEVVESFRISSQIEVFNEIQRKGVNVSIWKRRPSKNIIKYLDSIINNKNFSFEIDAEDIDRVEHFLPIHNNISNLEFANEIKKLSSIFANITNKKHHTIQITTVKKCNVPCFM